MAAISFASLPKEIWLDIGQVMPQTDLLVLSLVNKALRDVAQSHLYASIKLKWNQQCNPPIMLLLRSLLERPDLACWIRSLRLEGSWFVRAQGGIAPHPNRLPNVIALPANEVSAAVNSVGTSSDTAQAWIEMLQSGNADASVALLISLLPRLSSLLICRNWGRESRFFGALFRAALRNKDRNEGRLPSFGLLNCVSLWPRLDHDGHRHPENTHAALALFYLPTIERLSVSIDNPIQFSWPFPTPPNPSSLTCLRLYRIRECRLEPLLSALGNLQKLYYKWFYQEDIDVEVSEAILRLDVMAAAIVKCSKTLMTLEIESETQPATSMGMYEPPDVDLQGSLQEFSRLHKLQTLQVPWVFLMGMEKTLPNGRIAMVLPLHLEHLTLTGDLGNSEYYEWEDESIIRAIESELESGAIAMLKSLKGICLPFSVYGNSPSRAALNERCQSKLNQLGDRFNLELMNDSERSEFQGFEIFI